eukprot:COSAG01_NODE_604_length_14894_cov_24.503211_17_plen_260_part_00
MQRQPATTGLQIRVNRGRGPLLPSIQPLPGRTVCCAYDLDISSRRRTRSAGQAAARSMGAAAPESTHFCTNVPLDSVAYCLPVWPQMQQPARAHFFTLPRPDHSPHFPDMKIHGGWRHTRHFFKQRARPPSSTSISTIRGYGPARVGDNISITPRPHSDAATTALSTTRSTSIRPQPAQPQPQCRSCCRMRGSTRAQGAPGRRGLLARERWWCSRAPVRRRAAAGGGGRLGGRTLASSKASDPSCGLLPLLRALTSDKV